MRNEIKWVFWYDCSVFVSTLKSFLFCVNHLQTFILWCMSTVLHVFPRPTRLFSMRNCWCLIKSLIITITILVLAGHCPRCWIYRAALPIKKENSDLFVQQNCIWSESWKMSACCRFNSWITLNVLSSDFCVSWNIHQNFLPRKYIFLRFNPFKVVKQIVWKFLSWFKVILDQDKNLKSTVLHVVNWSHEAGPRQTKWLLHSHQCYKKTQATPSHVMSQWWFSKYMTTIG